MCSTRHIDPNIRRTTSHRHNNPDPWNARPFNFGQSGDQVYLVPYNNFSAVVAPMSPGRNSMNWACCFDNQHVAATLHGVDAASTRARPAVGLHMQSVLSSSLSFHTLEFGRHTVEGQASSQGGRGQVWSDSCKSYSAEQQGSGCCYGLLAFMTKTRGCKRLTLVTVASQLYVTWYSCSSVGPLSVCLYWLDQLA